MGGVIVVQFDFIVIYCKSVSHSDKLLHPVKTVSINLIWMMIKGNSSFLYCDTTSKSLPSSVPVTTPAPVELILALISVGYPTTSNPATHPYMFNWSLL